MAGDRDGDEQIDAAVEEATSESGGELHRWPRPGRAVRQLVLLDLSDERGWQREVAVLEADGTLRVTGHDRGPRVSTYFGPGTTSYEWVYVVPPSRVANLLRAMGDDGGGDVLALLADHYERTQGRIGTLLRRPEVAAEFDNWHR